MAVVTSSVDEETPCSTELEKNMLSAATAYRQRDFEVLNVALRALDGLLQIATDRPGDRAARASQLDKILEKELFGHGGVEAWLAPLLMQPAVAEAAEGLIDVLRGARREEVMEISFSGAAPLQISVANSKEPDWTMADGRFVWHGARSLVQLLRAGDSAVDVRGKRVLELGCGLGLVGLTCARDCGAAAVVLTDCDDGMLAACQRSAELNGLVQVVSTLRLDWAEVQHCGQIPEGACGVDIVFGADIIYEREHAPLLLDVVSRFIQGGGASEAVLVSGTPKSRIGVADLDALLAVDETCLAEQGFVEGFVSFPFARGDGQLRWSLRMLPEIERGKPQRMYRFMA